MRENHGVAASGHLKITEVDVITGYETVVLDERNLIVDSGVTMIPRALNPKATTNNRLGVIKFGIDVGTGTEDVPEQPTKSLTTGVQDVVFSVPIESMNYTTTDTSITLSISLAGEDIVGAADYLKYTSAAIYSDNGTLFAYKRFPFRLFNRWVRAKIEWTISTIRDEGDGGEPVCPVLPSVAGVVIDAPTTNVDVGGTLRIRGYETFDDGSLVVVPNGAKWTSNNANVSFSSGANGALIISGSQAGTSIIQLSSGAYSDSRIIRIIEKVEVNELIISDDRGTTPTGIGAEVMYNVDFSSGGVKTRVTQTANWVFSPNVEVLSTDSRGVLVKILASGTVTVDVSYLAYASSASFVVFMPLLVESITITPVGSTRFDIGESMDITATAFYTNGESRLVTINDRWVYNGLAVDLKEIGVVGNLRITGKYRGDHDVRVYIDGIEGRIDFKVAAPITTTSVYGFPQTPIHVIPNITNTAGVRGVQSDPNEDDIGLSDFYLTSSSPLMDLVGGITVTGEGNHTITVNKDTVVGEVIEVHSKLMTTQPLKLRMSATGVHGDLNITFDSPTGDGVYVDHNGRTRRVYTTTELVELGYGNGDIFEIYGGCNTITITGMVGEIMDWGDFTCNSYNITSETLTKVPYIAPVVTSMDEMFSGCILFNQNLSAWCVTDFPTKPTNFDLGCASWNEPKPIWGTCPDANEIYKVVTSFASGTEVNIGGEIPLVITAITRSDAVLDFSEATFTLVYDDSKLFIAPTSPTAHKVEGLQRGVTSLTVSSGLGSTTVSVEVK